MTRREELAYAAGVFDGEGNVRAGLTLSGGRRRPRLSLQVAQGHPQMVERFQRAVGVGNVLGPAPWSAHNPKPSWWFGAYSRAAIHQICWILWLWLSDPKKHQFHKAFEKYHALRAECVNKKGR
jgi:hypothetical protein